MSATLNSRTLKRAQEDRVETQQKPGLDGKVYNGDHHLRYIDRRWDGGEEQQSLGSLAEDL